jgi:hypothetical protein
LGESVPCANEVAIDILATSDAAVKARRKRMNNLLDVMLKAKKRKKKSLNESLLKSVAFGSKNS